MRRAFKHGGQVVAKAFIVEMRVRIDPFQGHSFISRRNRLHRRSLVGFAQFAPRYCIALIKN
jgi:hypothetical protein